MEPRKRIFLTGGTGLVGGEITARLLARGHSVTALVHRERQIRSHDGAVLPALPWAGRAPPPGTVALLAGNIGQDRLGWNDRLWNGVASGHDLIIHCAAITQFDADEANYGKVNVEGTARILALAESGRSKLLHVSTAYVCGTRGGRVRETELYCGQSFANGYESSKAAAERLVRKSRVPAAVARPSIVVGHSATGAIHSFDTLYSAFRLIAEGRIRYMPATADATLDFVPINHVAAGIVALVEAIRSATGKTFHLVSGAPVPVGEFQNVIAAYPQFTAPRLVNPEDFDARALPALERRLHARVAGLYASYFQRSPQFDDSAFRALVGSGCPPTGAAFLRKLIDYCISVGFLGSANQPRAAVG